MTLTQLQHKAFDEWRRSSEKMQRYHTFEFYWWEQYARVYRLPVRVEINFD